MTVDPDRITRLLREVAAEEVLPRYRQLASHEVRRKDRGEPVTVADEAAEKALEKALKGELPGSVVVGEERTADDPGLFDLLSDPTPVWVVDPIDGTRNFAKGQGVFALMVALVIHGEACASWIFELPRERDAVAEKGSGAWIDGTRMRVARGGAPGALRGTLHASTWAAPEIARKIERNRHQVQQIKSLGCAGAEYLRLGAGEMHFCLFTKLMPWDHAPGTLMVREAGGIARTLDGRDYQPRMHEGPGLLMAPDAESWAALYRTLLEESPPRA